MDKERSTSRAHPIALACMALTACALGVAQAQTPGRPESQAVTAPLPGSLSAWPEASGLRHGAHVLITTLSEPNEAYPCKLVSLDDRGVRCDGRHHRLVIFDRATVRSMALPARSFHNVVLGFAIGGAALTGGGLLCAVAGGGAGCAVLLASGLITALLTPLLHGIDEIHGRGVQTPVYIAPPPTVGLGSAE